MTDIHDEDHDLHEGEEEHEEDEGLHAGEFNIKKFKIGMLFAIWLCCLAGVLPKLIPCISKNPIVLSFLNCFSAGIFLGMALIHIIPEGIEIYELWAERKGIENPFPLDYVMIFVGYMLVLAVDRVISGWLLKITGKEKEAHIGHSHGGGGDHDHTHGHEHDHDDANKKTENPLVVPTATPAEVKKGDGPDALPVAHLGHDHGAAHSHKLSGEAHYHMENNECESP